MAVPKKREHEIESSNVKLEVVEDYPKAYKRRLKRIEIYRKALEFVRVRVIGYPVVIYEVIKNLATSSIAIIRRYQNPISGVVREVWNRLMDGDLKPYPVLQYGDGKIERPRKTARRIAIFIVSFYYAGKLGFKSKGLVMFPLLVAGLWFGSEMLESMGIAEGWEFGAFMWAGSVVFLGITSVYSYFGYMKSPQFQGIRRKYYKWVAKKITTDEDEEK